MPSLSSTKTSLTQHKMATSSVGRTKTKCHRASM